MPQLPHSVRENNKQNEQNMRRHAPQKNSKQHSQRRLRHCRWQLQFGAIRSNQQQHAYTIKALPAQSAMPWCMLLSGGVQFNADRTTSWLLSTDQINVAASPQCVAANVASRGLQCYMLLDTAVLC